MKFFRSRFFTILLAVLIATTATLGIVHASGVEIKGISEWEAFSHERNPDNLITMDDSYIEDLDTNRGVEIKVSDDGVIRLYGEATEDYSVKVATVALEPGTYTLSGMDDVNVSEFYMYTVVNGGQKIAGTDSATFTLTEAATVDITLSWVDEYDFGSIFGTKILPVLVEGDTAGEFWK